MKLPKFLLGDNTEYPEAIFVIHTEYPRFVLNIANDDLEWFDDLQHEDQAELTIEVEQLLQQANSFYDRETKHYE